ncbi:MAG TPA: XRE family transcriptional regulator, partial [Streptosporangiaceae bacterium]|nr:XRE family transcriptional regulator [Streptosporangiaceae bacterium]
MRIAFGDPQSAQVRTRGAEEGGGGGMAARIHYALAWYRPILGTPNLEVRFHSTVLYNSILRFDEQ